MKNKIAEAGRLAAACAGLALASGTAAAGYYYEATTTSEGEGFGRGGQVMRVHGFVDEQNARMEFAESSVAGPVFKTGSYIVTNDGGSTLRLVDPAEMQYMALDLNGLLGFAGAILNATGGAVQMEFSDFVNEQLAEGPGEELLGYDTMRYEFRTGYTMSISVLGFTRRNMVDTHLEFWCTDEIDAAGFRLWLRPDRFRTGNAEFDELIEQQYQAIDCLPLRMHSTTVTSGSGDDSTTTSVTEVTELREESGFEPAIFEVPEGYTETSLIPELSGAFEAPQGEGAAETEPATEEAAPRIRLRDLLRR